MEWEANVALWLQCQHVQVKAKTEAGPTPVLQAKTGKNGATDLTIASINNNV